GLHAANGKQLFACTIGFDFKASFGAKGDPVCFAQTILSTKDGDKLIFAVREAGSGNQGGGNAPRAGRNRPVAANTSDKVVWLMADLPKVDLSSVPVLEGEPAATVRQTEMFSFFPKVT